MYSQVLRCYCLVFLVYSTLLPLSVAHGTEQQELNPEQRVQRVLEILGDHGPGNQSDRCAGCHSFAILTFYRWSEMTNAVERCFKLNDENNNLAPANQRLSCLDKLKGEESEFLPKHLGIFSGEPLFKSFAEVFEGALPNEQAAARLRSLEQSAVMPPVGEPMFSAEEFGFVRQWFLDKMPALEKVVGGVEGAPTQCKTSISDDLVRYLQERQTQSWQTKNLDQGMLMFACPASSPDVLSCFTEIDPKTTKPFFPERNELRNHQDFFASQVMFRHAYDINFVTNFWMRVSADGRFVGNGQRESEIAQEPEPDPPVGSDSKPEVAYRARISDLDSVYSSEFQRRDIKIAGYYDPSFFPDNSGFMMQGTKVGAGFCPTGLIEDPQTKKVDFTEGRCVQSDRVTLYQSVGASLDGEDYWTIAGTYHSDSGREAENESNIEWGSRSELHLNQFQFDGERYVVGPRHAIWTPFVGDWISAPSSGLIAARLGGMIGGDKFAQIGYRFYLSDDLPSIKKEADLHQVAEICVPGGKGQFSFDERYLAYFHYVKSDEFQDYGFKRSDEPDFKKYLDHPTSNIFLLDLMTGRSTRLTNAKAGQRAMFPSFRSDGWIYFLLVEQQSSQREIIVTDAAIRANQLSK